MKYRKFFRKILYYFKFKYCSCNDEEIISLHGKNGLVFEISIESNYMDLIVENGKVRENYRVSAIFTKVEQEEINRIFNSLYSTETKLEQLNIFFENYIHHIR